MEFWFQQNLVDRTIRDKNTFRLQKVISCCSHLKTRFLVTPVVNSRPTISHQLKTPSFHLNRHISCHTNLNFTTSFLSSLTSVTSLTSCCGSWFYPVDPCFHTAPVALASLITTWKMAKSEREVEDEEEEGWSAASLHRRILCDCLDRLVELKMQPGPVMWQ